MSKCGLLRNDIPDSTRCDVLQEAGRRLESRCTFAGKEAWLAGFYTPSSSV